MTTSQELDWMQVMRKLASLIGEKNLTTALIEVDAFLSSAKGPAIQSDALGMRADIKEQLHDVEGAKQDLLTARSLVGPSYSRYVHELCLGKLCLKQQEADAAISWYRAALQTCVGGVGISGGSALREFLRLRGQKSLSPEEQALCTEVVVRSWDVLGLSGRPDLTNLQETASRIKDEAKPSRK